ncbi:hypothetical protein [Sigmofec virus UA08Rod_4411]|uniref:Uncharacterized protein n=1 Tax=Sigmofec virus UA08Rod_4411 TaxID=2929401 RepID=A0A976N1D8_9VIRU|nr:hypothetical protein [Sigmofec virus UA08Rod_4411]
MIMSFNSKYRTFGKVCSLSSSVDIPVIPNLSVTPSQMAEMVSHGIPVSSQILGAPMFDGVSNPSWDLPIDQRRGVDIASVWQAQRESRSNITSKVVNKDG